MLQHILRHGNGHLDWLKRLLSARDVEAQPVVDGILDIADAVDVTQYFEATGVLWVAKASHLLLAAVREKVLHALVDRHKSRLGPLKCININETVQIVEAKADDYSVARCHLNFVLRVSR